MSLNQLLLDEIKPYLNLRCNNLVVDGDVEKYEGTLNWTGAISGSSDYVAYVVGKMCMLRLNIFNDVNPVSANISSNNFPDELVPTGTGIAEGTCIVLNANTRVLGAINITLAGELQIQRINPSNNAGDAFTAGALPAGWNRPIVFCYQLDQ